MCMWQVEVDNVSFACHSSGPKGVIARQCLKFHICPIKRNAISTLNYPLAMQLVNMHCWIISENDRIMNLIDYNNPLYKPLADDDDISIADDESEGEDSNLNESHRLQTLNVNTL